VTCLEARRSLEALVDRALDPGAESALRGHLLACADCAGHHRAAVTLPSRLRALTAPPAPDLTRAVMSRVAPPGARPELTWALATLELVLGCLVLLELSGSAGLASTAGSVLRDAGWLLSSNASTPLPVPADLVLFLALLALIGCTAAHLALLSRGARRHFS
jgi:hypothetical protein